jgi:hypothetical protein
VRELIFKNRGLAGGMSSGDLGSNEDQAKTGENNALGGGNL